MSCVRAQAVLLTVFTILLSAQSALAGEPRNVVTVRGQLVEQDDRALLLLGEILGPDGSQIGSYFERFTPTAVDPKTKLPVAGRGQSVFRLPGGTIRSVNESKIVGPGPKPKTFRAKTAGRIVNGTGEFKDLKGTFNPSAVLTAEFAFESRVTFSVPVLKQPEPPVVAPAGHCGTCAAPVCPAEYSYECCRQRCCEDRHRGIFGCFRR